jgi:hypothetical protein
VADSVEIRHGIERIARTSTQTRASSSSALNIVMKIPLIWFFKIDVGAYRANEESWYSASEKRVQFTSRKEPVCIGFQAGQF